MDWKKDFMESYILTHSTDKSKPNIVQAKCIDLAYKDMMTAGRYYKSSFSTPKDEICHEVNEAITQCDYVFSRNLIQKIAPLFCDGSIGSNRGGNRYVTGYGLAQKLINMTYKYLYVFSDLIFVEHPLPDFSSCDCPLDSIILKKAKIVGVVWSKLSPQEYEKCQDKISDLLKLEPHDEELSKLGNLAYDFLNW